MPRFGGFIGSQDNRAGLRSKLGRYLAVRTHFLDLNTMTAGSWSKDMQLGMGDNTIPLITLERFTPNVLDEVNAGKYDNRMIAFHDAMRNWINGPGSKLPTHTVWFRPFHEFNGSWYPWSGPPADWKRAWNRILPTVRL
jgi:hypothetical protein